jgi:Xaa-Pro aminopeptidase
MAAKLKSGALAIVHSNDEMPRNGDQFFPYRQNSDFFYLTGIPQERSILVLFPEHPVQKNREILFISKPDPKFEMWNGKRLTKSEAISISGIQNIQWLDDFDKLLDELAFAATSVYLNSNENPRFSTDVPTRDVRFIKDIKRRFPLHPLERLAPLLTELRLTKEPEEINIMQHACDITSSAFDWIMANTQPGIFEYEIEAGISYQFRKLKAQGHAFAPIVATGENGCVLHYVSNNSQCKDGDLLLLDFGAEFMNYAADCSRTIPVNGRFTPRQRQFYDATLRVFQKSKALMRKGTTIAHIGKLAGKLWEEEHVNLGLYSMNDLKNSDSSDPLYAKYFPHGITHFLGLDVHDVGSRFHTLEAGMVLTCEPGIYVQEEGIGIRIENDILITEDEPIDLMRCIPIEAEEIEEIMNSSRSHN